ncbi:MAG: hypothetical protein WCS65_13055 [Verrucomicrobiae bacterium]
MNKRPARPSKLYSDVGNMRVGGPMRLAADTPVPRNPPRLPIIVKSEAYAAAEAKGGQPPPSPAPTLSSSATPMVVTSPVPAEADGYFQAPAQTSALGGLFDSVFVPPTPPTPTAVSTAKYQEVK